MSALQCQTIYPLTSRCWANNPDKVDCRMIFQGDYYGREASEYATYIERSATSPGSGAAAVPAGAASATTAYSFEDDVNQVAGMFNLPNHSGGVRGVLETTLIWLIRIIGLIAIIAFMISGLQYFLAAGDDKMMETAKRNMVYSILGVIAALSGYVILLAVMYALQGNSFF